MTRHYLWKDLVWLQSDRFERESWTGDARPCVRVCMLHSCRVSDRPVPPYTHWNAHRDSLDYMLDILCLNDSVHVQFHYGKDLFTTCTEKYKPTPKNGADTATNQTRSARYDGSKKTSSWNETSQNKKSLTWISSYEEEAPSAKTQLHFL